jgi:hypothetical protein
MHVPATRPRSRRIAAGMLVAALAAGFAVTGASAAHAVGSAQCAPGEAQLDFVNASGIPDTDVYGTVVVAAGTVTPAAVVDASPSLPLAGNFPTDPSDASGHTYYLCLQPGVVSGRLWLSIGAPIVGLPSVQPTVSEPYRFGYIEFSYPGQIDYSNINDFDFPISLRAYDAPGATTPAQQAVFTGSTCQIVNAMRDAVTAVGANADWSRIYDPGTTGFVRIIAPDNGAPDPSPYGWPDLRPYIRSLAGETITVQDYYVGGNADPGNVGWFQYTGTFGPTGDLTLTGSLGSDSAPGVASGANFQPAGPAVATTLDELAFAIYSQQIGAGYTVGGVADTANDVFAYLWNDLTSAFAYGYWGSGYGTGLDTRDFFATFPTTPGTAPPTGGQPAFAPARTIPYPATDPAGGVSYNLYASVLSRFSPNYAFPFNENYGQGGAGTNPLLTIPAGGLVTATLPSDGWDGAPGSTTCATAPAPDPDSGSTPVTDVGPVAVQASRGASELAASGAATDPAATGVLAGVLVIAGGALALASARAVRRRRG